jgi:uncharacterized protein (TIGR00369 family)
VEIVVLDPATETLLRKSFAAQGAMRALGAAITSVEHGVCRLELPHHEGALQQHGYFHGGIVGALADSAAGYAANSVLMPSREVLTVEYKINFLSPAKGERLCAEGRVVKSGRTLTVVAVEVWVETNLQRTACALAQMTMIAIESQAHQALATTGDDNNG